MCVCALLIRLIINFQLLALGLCQVLWVYRNCHIQTYTHTHTHRTHMIKRKDHHMPIFNYFNDFSILDIFFNLIIFHFVPQKTNTHSLPHSLVLYFFYLHIPLDSANASTNIESCGLIDFPFKTFFFFSDTSGYFFNSNLVSIFEH